jgi:hypothetical protein
MNSQYQFNINSLILSPVSTPRRIALHTMRGKKQHNFINVGSLNHAIIVMNKVNVILFYYLLDVMVQHDVQKPRQINTFSRSPNILSIFFAFDVALKAVALPGSKIAKKNT